MPVSLEGTDRGQAWRITAPTPAELRGRELRSDRLTSAGGLTGCLACGHAELYTQRDFPRALGLAIVGIAAVLAPFTWYASLLVAAVLDALLFWRSRTVVVCYACAARHRGFAPEPRHPRYDLGIAERLRFGPKAVMGSTMRSGGTAGAPEPEH